MNSYLSHHHPSTKLFATVAVLALGLEELNELIACNFYLNNWAGCALENDCAKYMWSHYKCRCTEHACEHHPTFVHELSSEAVVTVLNKDSSDSIFFLLSIVYQTAIPCGLVFYYPLHIAVSCNADAPPGCATWTLELLTTTLTTSTKGNIRELVYSHPSPTLPLCHWPLWG